MSCSRLQMIALLLTGGEIARAIARENRELGVRLQNEKGIGVNGSALANDDRIYRLVPGCILNPYRLRRTSRSDSNDARHRREKSADLRTRQIDSKPVGIRIQRVDVRRLPITNP